MGSYKTTQCTSDQVQSVQFTMLEVASLHGLYQSLLDLAAGPRMIGWRRVSNMLTRFQSSVAPNKRFPLSRTARHGALMLASAARRRWLGDGPRCRDFAICDPLRDGARAYVITEVMGWLPGCSSVYPVRMSPLSSDTRFLWRLGCPGEARRMPWESRPFVCEPGQILKHPMAVRYFCSS